MPDQVPEEVKADRNRRLLDVTQRVAAEQSARLDRAYHGGAGRRHLAPEHG